METMNVTTYSAEGKKIADSAVPSYMFQLPWNGDLVHQVVTGMQSNARTGLAHTKGRGEVSGGGKKPWRQKGTGRARHGSSRSPIWIGGGITHGPNKEKNYDKKINRKMKTKALFVTLSQKLADNKMIFVDDFKLAEIKTTGAMRVLQHLATIDGFNTINTPKHNNILILVPEKTPEIGKSFRNLPHVTVKEIRNVNPVDVMTYRYLIVEKPVASTDILSLKTVSSDAVAV
jgi:large subunit ribosomal protein L4